jgi:hypothetical protein
MLTKRGSCGPEAGSKPRPPGRHEKSLIAADLLKDRVIPFYEEHGIPLQRVLTAGQNIAGPTTATNTISIWRSRTSTTRTKARSPQTYGVVERFHKTMVDEF